ncbi:MAG: DUF4142 domain-containing protein [Candidatus Xenobia bacterium]
MKQATLWSTLAAFLLLIGLLHTCVQAQGPGGPGVVGPPTSYPDGPGSGGSRRHSSADAFAITQLSTLNVVEILMSTNAANHSQNPTIQHLAQQMAIRYNDVGKQLEQVAHQIRLEASTHVALNDETRATLRSLQRLKGPDFDTKYLTLLRLNQGQIVSVLRQMESQSDNPRLRDFARHQLAAAEADLKAVQQFNTPASSSPTASPTSSTR